MNCENVPSRIYTAFIGSRGRERIDETLEVKSIASSCQLRDLILYCDAFSSYSR